MMAPSTETAPELTPLAQKLAGRIAAEGPITLHDYMEACLYDPAHGYYKKRDPLGRGGDFITAPEISQVFGELIGLWAGETWRMMGQPSAVRLIELGPGRGTLMADALRALRVLPAFLQCASVHLIETSQPLRAAQEAALEGAPCPICWHERIEEIPAGAAIVIANEFFDCLPVRQFAFDETAHLWRERMVGFKDGGFKFELNSDGMEVPPHPALLPEGRRDPRISRSEDSRVLSPLGERDRVRGGFPSIEDGAIAETRPGTAGVLQGFAARAENAPLAALVIDYGYSQPSTGDTVQAVKLHRFAGLFEAPGEADLTAHVDFAGLIQQAKELNLAAYGPMPMGEWLLRLGLEARVHQLLRRASPEEAAELRSRVSRLVDPSQMGALFKAIVLAAGVSAPPPPF
jgi:NADH dehydrogenase [ubiquinone] 1 alpha subcomplex assembly factor 7